MLREGFAEFLSVLRDGAATLDCVGVNLFQDKSRASYKRARPITDVSETGLLTCTHVRIGSFNPLINQLT